MTKDEFDVVVVGAIGVDTNVYLYTEDIDWSVEMNFAQNIDYVGQAGGYSVQSFKRLGFRTGFIGAVGFDHNGRFIREELSNAGIPFLMLIDPKGTKRSINIMYQGGQRKNFYDGKGSMDIQPDLGQVREFLRGTTLVHMNIVNWARYLIPVIKELGITLSVDIQDIVDIHDEYRKDFVEEADILFFSCVNFPDPLPLVEQFIEKNPNQLIIVGMGSKGCALTKDGKTHFYNPVEIDEQIIDTNGAGDSLATGFLTSYVLEGRSAEESIMRGQLNARFTCGIKGSSSTLMTKDQLEEYMQRYKLAR